MLVGNGYLWNPGKSSMTRSFRKNPIIGMGSSSEKWDKRKYNRKLRAKVRREVKQDTEILTHLREVSNPWSMAKDGKFLFNPRKHPKLLRK